SLGRGLRPLNAMAGELRSREADDMRPIDTGNAPSEVKPLAEAINGLFDKVETARRHEREVTAFAAHELRTPLAGLKTQAQIAIAAADPAVREGALRQILVSVDRTTRLVRQLLAMARLDSGSDDLAIEKVNAGELLDEILEGCRSLPKSIRIERDPRLNSLTLRANREVLKLALRNLHENAVEHMAAGGTVAWRPASDGHGVVVEDEGPGIPEEELPLVTQRFYRGRHRSASGTGLGLAIAELAAKRLGGGLVLRNRDDRTGLDATIILPVIVGGTPGRA
ncbi:ATP-binding protein, partial [Rhizobiaceae sp. 2RAB30]